MSEATFPPEKEGGMVPMPGNPIMGVFRSVANCFGSITFIVVLLAGVSFVTLFGLLCYWGVRGSLSETNVQTEQIKPGFIEVLNGLNNLQRTITFAVFGLRGFCMKALDWMVANPDYHNAPFMNAQAVYALMQFSRSLESQLGTTMFNNGLWYYNAETGEQTAWTYYENEYSVDMGHYSNISSYTYEVSEFLDVNMDLDQMIDDSGRDTWSITDESWEWDYFPSVTEPYWDYWVWDGESSEEEMEGSVYLSFDSMTNMTIPYPLNETIGTDFLVCDSWFGINIWRVSELLKENAPEDSLIWIVESGYDMLLGASDADKTDDLYKWNKKKTKRTILSAREYKNEIIAGVTVHILDDEELLNKFKLGEIKEIDVLGYHVAGEYIDMSDHYGEWLVFVAKPRMKIYGRVIAESSISGGVTIVIALVISVLWFIICLYILRAYAKIVKQFRRIEDMNLEPILKPRGQLSEVKTLMNKVTFMMMKLKEYSAFLPAHLTLEDEGDYELDENSSEMTHTVNSSHVTESSITSTDPADSAEPSTKSGGSSMSGRGVHRFKLGLDERVGLLLRVVVEKNDACDELPSNLFFERLFSVIRKFKGHIFQFSTKKVDVLFHSGKVRLAAHCQMHIFKENWDDTLYRVESVFITNDIIAAGNLGSNRQKTYTVEGPGYDNLATLHSNVMEVSGGEIGRCYTTASVNDDLENSFESRKLPPVGDSSVRVFELGRCTTIKNDEWLYEWKNKQELERWDEFNQAVTAFEEGNNEKAKLLMTEFAKSQPDDGNARKWVEIMEKTV